MEIFLDENGIVILERNIMKKGIRKINLISTVFISILFVFTMTSRLISCQVNPQEQNLEKENPIAIYLASAVFSVDDLLLVDTGLEL